jgi:anti-sigma B factor antagonist
MNINSVLNDTAAIIKIEGSLSADVKVEFEKEINLYIDKPIHIILDLSNVTFIDSTTLGAIVKYYSLYRKKNRYLLLSSINKQIYEVFRLTGISKQIEIFETPQLAVDFIRDNS